MKRWVLLFPLFFFIHAYGEEEFSSYFIDYVDHGKKATVGVVCIDSFALNNKETSCEVTFYKTSQKSVERRMLFQNKGGWRTASKDLGPKMNEQDQVFIDFINQFSSSKEFQFNHIIFPLPVRVKEADGASKKKLVMPRDWEMLNYSQLCNMLYTIQSGREGNNRKIYIYHRGVLQAFYNFIYINKNWYLIEIEIF